jgi:hypothetical protein
MIELSKALRNQLDATVREARDTAETAAEAVLNFLGVPETSPPPHLSGEAQELRELLKSHGRHLGDIRDGDGF